MAGTTGDGSGDKRSDAAHPALTDEELLALPKVDLHLHLVGSAAPHTVAGLAARHPDSAVPADVSALREFYAFRDFAHFLTVYTSVSLLVRDPADVVALVMGLGDDLRSQGVEYAEATVTPVTHARAGIGPAALAAALSAGAADVQARTGVELAWVYDISGGDGIDGARGTLDAALSFPPDRLVGFGLGGPEAGARRSSYAEFFAAARSAGLHSVPHAGETVGPHEVWSSLRDLGAERIGHGIAAHRDPALLEHLHETGIPLEVCPSSNVATGAVRSLDVHPLPALLAAGVRVTLGSDDPPMFATSLLEEYRRARDVLGLDRATLLELCRTGIDVSFAPDTTKDRLRAALPVG